MYWSFAAESIIKLVGGATADLELSADSGKFAYVVRVGRTVDGGDLDDLVRVVAAAKTVNVCTLVSAANLVNFGVDGQLRFGII